MVSVGIIGASGYSGGELLRILLGHEKVEEISACSKSNEGMPYHSVHPNLRGVEGKFIGVDYGELAQKDVVFAATPSGVAMEAATELFGKTKFVDLSADFRLPKEVYERWYGIRHACPELIKEAVYGLPEINREKIRKAKLIANPGCYPTGATLALAPLMKSGAIELERIAIDSKSGSSGAGDEPTPFLHHPEVCASLKHYNLTNHRHMPEIERNLSDIAGKNVVVSFTPMLVPILRGILTTVHAFWKKEIEEDEALALYQKFYRGEPFVRVLSEEERGAIRRTTGGIPSVASIAYTNYCDIGVKVDAHARSVIAMSAIDNLGKGAAGQAVQNMNIMFGFKETTGLELRGFHP